MSSAQIPDNLHILIEMRERLEEFQRDLDRQFQPAALKLYGANIPGGQELRDQMQAFGSYLESLVLRADLDEAGSAGFGSGN